MVVGRPKSRGPAPMTVQQCNLLTRRYGDGDGSFATKNGKSFDSGLNYECDYSAPTSHKRDGRLVGLVKLVFVKGRYRRDHIKRKRKTNITCAV